MSVAVIVNPVAGGARPETARARAELVAAVLREHGEEGDIFVTERAGHGRSLAETAVARGARLVVAWGGDGTINEIASVLAFGDIPLGIIPSGSGNGLASEMGIDPRPERALAAAIRATPSAIDLGELSGRLFVNLAGIGIDAHVAAQFNVGANVTRGFAKYLRIGARALLTYEPETYAISISSPQSPVTRRSRALLIVVANSPQFGNGARIAPGARVDDGELDLVVVEETSRLVTILQTPRLFRGSIARAPGYSRQRIREATIESDRPMAFHVDGEPVQGGTALVARVHPGALRVCVT